MNSPPPELYLPKGIAISSLTVRCTRCTFVQEMQLCGGTKWTSPARACYIKKCIKIIGNGPWIPPIFVFETGHPPRHTMAKSANQYEIAPAENLQEVPNAPVESPVCKTHSMHTQRAMRPAPLCLFHPREEWRSLSSLFALSHQSYDVQYSYSRYILPLVNNMKFITNKSRKLWIIHI